MADESAKIDANQKKTLLGVTNAATPELRQIKVDATTSRLLCSATVSGVSSVTVANEATDTTCFPLFVTAATGSLGLKTNAGLTFNSNSGLLGAVALKSNSSITLGVAGGTTGSIILNGTTSGVVTLKVADVAGTYTLTLPTTDGDANQLLKTDGSGNLSWTDPASGGATTALDNLASVAINTSLISDTTNTDDLGSSTKLWKDLFVTNIGATATRVTKGWFTDIESTNMPTVGGVAILTSLTAPQFTTIELGHASDTTISRSAAGVLAVEGTAIPKGTGTGNEIAYWSGTNTLGTLATATYPSLTELSYVKGVTSAIQTQIGNKANSASPTFTGTITLADNCRIDLTLPTADGYATGPTTDSFNAGYSSTAIGDLVYLGSSSTWQKVDADAIATSGGLLGVALEVKASGNAVKVALFGSMVRVDSWNWTAGATLYASETPGGIATAIPTGADGVVRVIGWAVNADAIMFMPSSDNSTVVA